MSFSLKHIPCPAGKTCTAFQCIFGHGQENADLETKQPASPAPSHRAKPVTAQEASSPVQEAPRKRIKIDQAPNNTNKEINPKAVPQSATRAVSPPPLRRDVGSTTTTKKKPSSSIPQPASTKDTKPSITQKVKAVTALGNESSKKRKPESLNPRLLKSSPASHETRLKLIKMLHHEFTRLNLELKKSSLADSHTLILSDQELISRALDEEQTTALEKPAVYANVMKNKVIQHKRMNVAQWKDARIKEAPQPTQGQNGGNIPKEIVTGLTSAQEVELLKRIVTPIDNLSNHGYVSSVPTEEAIEAARTGLDAGKGWEKCDRCQQRFQVFPGRRAEDGALASGGACNFHWGKTYIPAKAPGDMTRVPKRYRCCGQEVGDSASCSTHDNHVFKVSDPKRLAVLLNYANTPENPDVPKDRAVCFDCEMGYTVHGMELIRLTATSWPSGEELLDVLVQPIGEILDLNSRYSGVWPEDFAMAKTWTPGGPTPGAGSRDTASTAKNLRKVASPEVARSLLFSLIAPTTPLIGHGLENDLNSVRIVHPTLLDTVLLYPHKLGLPYRYSLKGLMEEYLNRKIQQETGPTVLGHDSAEDARAAGELVRLKVRNEWKDMQHAGWTLVDGKFRAPGEPGLLTTAFIEGK